MTPVEFLKDRLGNLAQLFPQVRIKYAFDRIIDTHIVELTPVYEYYHNSLLDEQWIPISMEFDERFPAEDISFISSDSSLKIDKPELEWNGEVEALDLEKYNEWIAPLNNKQIQDVEFADSLDMLIQVPDFSLHIQSVETFVTSRMIHCDVNFTSKEIFKKNSTLDKQNDGSNDLPTDSPLLLAA